MESLGPGNRCAVTLTAGSHVDTAVDAAPWWVIHTRARHEKVIARMLAEGSVEHYLPLVSRTRTYGGRRQQVEMPLFPGYLFFRGAARERDVAWRTNRIAQILPVVDQAQLGRELQHIRRLVDSGAPVNLYAALKRGRRCRVTGGPLKDIEGVVVQRRGPARMYVAATILGQSATIEIDAELLAAID